MKKKFRKINQRKVNPKRYKRKKKLPKTINLFNKWMKLLIIILLIVILIVKRKNTNNINNNYIINNIIDNNVHIAISMDRRLIYSFISYLTSLLDNKKESSFYTIHILSNKIAIDESKPKINKVIEKFGNTSIEIKYHDLSGDFHGAKVGLFPLQTYYRIALPSLLPDLDRIIYTDVDMVNFKDLSEMYNIKFKDKMYICVPIYYPSRTSELEEFGIKANKYVNVGIAIFNLKAMREDDIENKIREFIKKNHNLKSFDQTAINAVCYNNIQILPFKYGIFSSIDSIDKLKELNDKQDIMYRAPESELIEAFNKPALLHHAGPFKPWNKRDKIFDNRVYWWYYAKMSGFYEEFIDYYRFEKDFIDDLLKLIPEDGGLLKGNYKKLD